jgi:hypothetical protein
MAPVSDGSPSLQLIPSGRVISEHAPVDGSQAAVWQPSGDAQVGVDPAMQDPAWHVSPT